MDEPGGRRSWGIEQRLEFIELRLFWEGRLNRNDLVQRFGISVPQASADLARYEERAPGNLLYDKSAKTYLKSPTFEARLTQPTADQYLNQLRLLFAGALQPEESWVGRPPSFCGTPRVQRHISVPLLEKLLEAIRSRRGVRLKYLSYSSPEPAARVIAPHALGFDGQRWHVRAWCETRKSFLDFVVARMSELSGFHQVSYDPAWDLEWHRQVEMRLVVNPAIEGAMRDAIQRDFGMRSGQLTVKASICASYYLESQLNLDLVEFKLPAQRLPVVLENRDEVHAARQQAKDDTKRLVANGLA